MPKVEARLKPLQAKFNELDAKSREIIAGAGLNLEKSLDPEELAARGQDLSAVAKGYIDVAAEISAVKRPFTALRNKAAAFRLGAADLRQGAAMLGPVPADASRAVLRTAGMKLREKADRMRHFTAASFPKLPDWGDSKLYADLARHPSGR